MIAFQLLPRGSPDESDAEHVGVISNQASRAPVAVQVQPRNHISYSSINLFRQCSLRYFFKYVAGLPEEKTSASFVFGRAIHRAVEVHFRELLSGGEGSNLDALLGEFQAGWDEQPPETITYPKSESESRAILGHLADRLLRAFLDSELSRPVGRIIGIEEELRGRLIDGVPDLLARLDLITETDDAITITDLKTARSAWSGQQADDSAEQLLLYGALVRRLIPHKPLRLEFMVATKTKEVSITRHAIPFDQRRLDRTKRIIERVWRAIAAEHFFPSPSPMNCPACPFRDPCRRWNG